MYVPTNGQIRDKEIRATTAWPTERQPPQDQQHAKTDTYNVDTEEEEEELSFTPEQLQMSNSARVDQQPPGEQQDTTESEVASEVENGDETPTTIVTTDEGLPASPTASPGRPPRTRRAPLWLTYDVPGQPVYYPVIATVRAMPTISSLQPLWPWIQPYSSYGLWNQYCWLPPPSYNVVQY